jgi:hypothetical protein
MPDQVRGGAQGVRARAGTPLGGNGGAANRPDSSISHEAGRYGLVGVTIALLSWLVVSGLLLVVSAVLSAALAQDSVTPGS